MSNKTLLYRKLLRVFDTLLSHVRAVPHTALTPFVSCGVTEMLCRWHIVLGCSLFCS